MPDDDDRPRDASSAADPAWNDAAQAAAAWADAVAPDDISDLADDIAAYHRELRAARRREVIRRLANRRRVAPISLLAAALGVVALVVAIFTIIAPGHRGPSSLPLATTTAAVGQPGSLLPNESLTDLRGKTTAAQSLRPALLALIPLRCNCQPELSIWADKATAEQVRMVVVAPTAHDAEATALAGRIDRGAVYYDSAGTLAHDFAATTATAVLVNRDGSVFRVLPSGATDPGDNLTPLLQQMLQRTSG